MGHQDGSGAPPANASDNGSVDEQPCCRHPCGCFNCDGGLKVDIVKLASQQASPPVDEPQSTVVWDPDGGPGVIISLRERLLSAGYEPTIHSPLGGIPDV